MQESYRRFYEANKDRNGPRGYAENSIQATESKCFVRIPGYTKVRFSPRFVHLEVFVSINSDPSDAHFFFIVPELKGIERNKVFVEWIESANLRSQEQDLGYPADMAECIRFLFSFDENRGTIFSMRNKTIFLLIMMMHGCIFAQPSAQKISSDEFKKTVQEFLRDADAWRAVVSEIKPEELGVSYPDGKAMDIAKDRALLFLGKSTQFAHSLEAEDSMLNDVNFLSSSDGLVVALQELSTAVLSFNTNDQARVNKASAWAEKLEDIANNRANPVAVAAYRYTAQRAARIDETCKVPGARGDGAVSP